VFQIIGIQNAIIP